MSTWKEKEAEYEAVHSFIKSVENEIDEVLRGEGKRKNQTNPRQAFGEQTANNPQTASKAAALTFSLRPQGQQQQPQKRPQQQHQDTVLRRPQTETREEARLASIASGTKTTDDSSGVPALSKCKRLTQEARHLRSPASKNDKGSKARKHYDKTDRTANHRNNVEEFEKRKAAICFGSEESSALHAKTASVTNEPSSTVVEFLEDSAFAQNSYATVVSPVDRRRAKTKSPASDKAPVIPDLFAASSSKTAGEGVYKAIDTSTSDVSHPFKEASTSQFSSAGSRDVLLEKLLQKEEKPVSHSSAKVTDLHQMIDSDRSVLLFGSNKQPISTGVESDNLKQKEQSTDSKQRKQQQKLKQCEQPTHISSPPIPPRRTSSIRKQRSNDKFPESRESTGVSPSSMSGCHRKIEENKIPHVEGQFIQLQHTKQEMSQIVSVKSTYFSHEREAESERHHKQQLTHHHQYKKHQKEQEEYNLSSIPRDEIPHPNISHQGLLQGVVKQQPRCSTHSLEQTTVVATERAQRERAARLMQIYEDVKKISRPEPKSLPPQKKSTQPSPQPSNRIEPQLPPHQRHNPVLHRLHKQEQLLQQQQQQHQQPQHQQQRQLQRQQQNPEVHYKRANQQKPQHHHLANLQKQPPTPDQWHHLHQPQLQRSENSQLQTSYRMPRAVSDHMTNKPRKPAVVASPRRYSDSETFREGDFAQKTESATVTTQNQTTYSAGHDGIDDFGIKSSNIFESFAPRRHQELDSAQSLCASPPQGFSLSGRRQSDTSLYSSQFSDFDEMTSSMEETIITPPPEFSNEATDSDFNQDENSPQSVSCDLEGRGLTQGQIKGAETSRPNIANFGKSPAIENGNFRNGHDKSKTIIPDKAAISENRCPGLSLNLALAEVCMTKETFPQVTQDRHQSADDTTRPNPGVNCDLQASRLEHAPVPCKPATAATIENLTVALDYTVKDKDLDLAQSNDASDEEQKKRWRKRRKKKRRKRRRRRRKKKRRKRRRRRRRRRRSRRRNRSRRKQEDQKQTSPQQGNLRLSGPPSGQDAGGGARTRDRRVPADLRADSLATVPPTPHGH
ncbi:hypothetical protein PoB_000120100 [Plakobranchus ocellatus]|uniref:Uncharacterized protein n=1 Tax=Plakobranchus ocellatus TaxID=259542 RepID=A0AAV3XX90_9GAST|nr:hypothetical protein PoB_000120100 [Plakobranchus ocellatus]